MLPTPEDWPRRSPHDSCGLRTAEAPGVRISLKKESPDKLAAARHPRGWPVALNVK